MSSHSLLALTVLVLALTAAATAQKGGPAVGGYQPIKNISDPHVKEIAEFAVSEYNKKAQARNKLVFQRVVRGDTQVVAGINYRLVISAKNVSAVSVSVSSSAAPDPAPAAAATASSYEAIVWEKAWEHFRQLTSFSIAKK